MQTVLIQITNEKAYKLLEDLEDLQIIRVISKSAPKLSEKYAGKLPADLAEELQHYVAQSRNEWNSRSI